MVPGCWNPLPREVVRIGDWVCAAIELIRTG